MKIYLVTGNPKKIKVARYALRKYGIDVEQLDMDTPEIQSSEIEEVARYSVKYASDKSNLTVMKGDFGMSIEALGGFPGPYVKYINKWLSTRQFINLYENEENKRAYFVDALGYCEPGKEPMCFVSRIFGKLVTKPKGNNGNMVDSLFVPDGFKKTVASLNEQEMLELWANDRFDRLAMYVKK